MKINIKDAYISSIKDASRLLAQNAEIICSDTDTERVSGINIRIYIDRESEPICDIEKEYVLNMSRKEYNDYPKGDWT